MPGLPPDGALQGSQIDGMMLIVHVLMATVFVGWLWYFVSTIIRGASGKAKAIKPHRAGRLALTSEILIALAEVTILGAFALPFWISRVAAFPDEHHATVVHVVAEQYVWNIHYPGLDGIFGRTDPSLVSAENPVGLDRSDPHAMDDVVSVNDMHLPVGIPVIIYLTSKDVIHSFSLPLYRIKQDAIPGQRIPIWFTPQRTSVELQKEMVARYPIDPADSVRDLSLLSPLTDVMDKEGRVVLGAGTPLTLDSRIALAQAGIGSVDAAPSTPTEIACAQLCGLGHYRMRGLLTVEPDSSYRRWLEDRLEASSSP
ncbi:MAG TPA: hypothetical protein VMG09_18545 [Bacteroidota bacterium]|nr:hypothetical protein [Bacteroidota bacterium]